MTTLNNYINMINNNFQQSLKTRIVLISLLIYVAGMTKAHAYDFSAVCETGQTLYYTITDATNHYVELTCPGTYWDGFTKPTGSIILPKYVYDANDNQYLVTTIGYCSFHGCTGLTGDLVIPNSVTTIDQRAFYGCSGLTSVFIPSSVKKIFFNVFEYCSGLEQIEVDPDNPNYDSRDNCCAIIETSLCRMLTGCKNSTIPSTVYNIGGDAFRGCTGLTSIVIPNSISQIGSGAFGGCTGLTTIDLPNVSYIGMDAFSGCSGLTSIVLSNSLTSICSSAFNGCTSLTSIVLPNSLQLIGYNAFQNCTSLTSITIPSSVTNIDYDYRESYGLFNGCINLRQIVVESGNTVYDSRENCNAIIETSTNTLIAGCMNTNIPNSVTAIGNSAFNGCTGLNSINFPNAITSIARYAFQDCSNLTELDLPENLNSIGVSAFMGCSSLTEVEISNSVVTIGSSAFKSCVNLTELTIGEGVTTIGGDAFYNCPTLQTVNFNAINCTSMQSESRSVFSSDNYGGVPSITDLVIGDNVQIIPDYAFKSARHINQEIVFPQHLATIGKEAFYNCGNVPNVSFSNTQISIGESAFYYCVGLSSISIPAISIGKRAFYQCTGLNAVAFGNALTTIGDFAFSGCDIEEIIVASENQVFDSRDNCNAIIITSTNELIVGCKNTVIPNSVTSIGSSAFSGCSGLTSLTIPNSVTSIGSSAFSGCSGLNSLTISNSVTSIGYSAFENCSGLTSLTIPNSVTSIGDYAFSGCSGLNSLTIPNSVTSIGKRAFFYCSGLSSITMFVITPPTLGSNDIFSGTSSTLKIYVPYESLNAYQTANAWSIYASRMRPMAYRTITGYGTGNDKWAFIASPLALSTAPTDVDNMIAATETNYDLYRFNQSAELQWENYKQEGNHYHFNLTNGQGYLYANKEDANIIFKGDFNEGTTQDVTLTYKAGKPLAGWNLVGNPFPYAATVNRSYYVMNTEGTGIEPIALSAGTSIDACTGIMVKATGSWQKVTFTKPSRTTMENNGLLQIAVATSTGTVADRAIVSFNEEDVLEKFVFNEDNAKLYIPQGGKDYAIVSVGRDGVHTVSTGVNEIPVNFRANKNGEYMITVNTEGVEMDYLHLIDNMTGADVDLLQTQSYSFDAKTTDYESRFRLVFNANDGSATGSEAFAFISNGEIIITGVADTCDVSLQVIDMQGRVLVCRDARSASTISTTGMAPGVYVLRLINGDNVRTQKMVID
jgi:hypothetical protein